MTFEVIYQNSGDLVGRFWYAWRTMLIVFEVVIGFPLLMWRLFQYMRKRRASEQADQVGGMLDAGVEWKGTWLQGIALVVGMCRGGA